MEWKVWERWWIWFPNWNYRECPSFNAPYARVRLWVRSWAGCIFKPNKKRSLLFCPTNSSRRCLLLNNTLSAPLGQKIRWNKPPTKESLTARGDEKRALINGVSPEQLKVKSQLIFFLDTIFRRKKYSGNCRITPCDKIFWIWSQESGCAQAPLQWCNRTSQLYSLISNKGVSWTSKRFSIKSAGSFFQHSQSRFQFQLYPVYYIMHVFVLNGTLCAHTLCAAAAGGWRVRFLCSSKSRAATQSVQFFYFQRDNMHRIHCVCATNTYVWVYI